MNQAMTPETPLPTRAALLAEPRLQAALRAQVRRRVGASEADDIVQATLCDALAATHTPADRGELVRWVSVIARHKIADHFRRARREERFDVAPAQLLHEPVDERALLGEIVRDAGAQPGGLRTLRWVAREAAGERLADIAREERLSPEVVRQRIARWRRRARAVFLLAAAALALAVVVPRLVTPASPARSTAAPTPVEGTWRVASVDVPDGADPRLRKLADLPLGAARLVVRGDRARLEGVPLAIERTFVLGPPERGVLRGTMRTFDGGSVPIEVRLDGDVATVAGGGGRFVLRR